MAYSLITHSRDSIKVYSINKSINACPSLKRKEIQYTKFYNVMKMLIITSLFLTLHYSYQYTCFFEHVTTNCPRVEGKSSSSQV